LNLFEHKIKIRTYLTKLDENWDQKGILTKKKQHTHDTGVVIGVKPLYVKAPVT